MLGIFKGLWGCTSALLKQMQAGKLQYTICHCFTASVLYKHACHG